MSSSSHQIITGALNAGESVFAVGSVDGINFTACAVGCDIVILASDFQRVQIIPGSTTGYVQVLCIDCCYETGKIAAAFYDLIRIYEPIALSLHSSKHKLDYQWFETCCFNAGALVTNLSWNLEGLRLLVSTEKELQMFQHRALTDYCYNGGGPDSALPTGRSEVKFELDHAQTPQLEYSANSNTQSMWECVWRNQLSSPLRYIRFSPDGTLFATAASNDSLVKIWYQDSGAGLNASDVTFSFIYLAHPKPVTGFEWRKTGRYMPRGCVVNVLITWCRDRICRIWCETAVQTEASSDVLLDLKSEKFPSRVGGLLAAFGDKDRHKHHRLKNARVKIAHRLKHLTKLKKTTGTPTKQKATDKNANADPRFSIPSLSLAPSVTGFPESFDLPPILHFHLAATISADTDCLLVPSFEGDANGEVAFAVHWLNNKELIFSLGAERLLAEALEIDHSGNTNGFHVPASPSMERRAQSAAGTDRASDDGSSTPSVTGEPANPAVKVTAPSNDGVSTAGSKDVCDRKLEQALRDWQHASDILFTIHPLDGSLLVWTAEFLDDCGRQPQISFSSRLPNAFPISDAASLNHNLAVFNPHYPIYLTLLHKTSDFGALGVSKNFMLNSEFPSASSNTLFLLTTHENGTLNLWHLNVEEKSKFGQILSIAHKSRMCGHRFRVSAIACHPVLPLFLTTSHHNVHRRKLQRKMASLEARTPTLQDFQVFNSELILWKVNPIGPLCKSGGVRELARINSSDISAFSSAAWIPAILPSSTLGSISNSPSSCFVASDSNCLKVYQAVIDARALLAEVNYAKAQKNRNIVLSPASSGDAGMTASGKHLLDAFTIVSTQSTARPGCIIELDPITDATREWRHIQLLHVFHEQMILGDQKNVLTAEETSAVIDRTKSTTFHDRFYVVVLEKNKGEGGGSIIHMWLLSMASQPPSFWKDGSSKASSSPSPDEMTHSGTFSTAKLFLYSRKVCTQQLPLPNGVKVIDACPGAGHLASSSLYPACRAPFLLTTACSDDRIRFWNVKLEKDSLGDMKYGWSEWRMVSETQDSQVEMDGKVFSVSNAYSGRFACSFDPSNSYDTTKSETVSVEIAVYECESTGGIEWQQEDVIHLRNIKIPRVAHVLEDYAFGVPSPVEGFLTDLQTEVKHGGGLLARVPSIPKVANSLRRVVSEHSLSRQDPDQSIRQVVRLDWVSTEDGSHVLTVGVGPKILLFAPVSENIAQQNVAIMKEAESINPLHVKRQQLLRKASTIAAPVVKKLIRWVGLRSIDLDSADGLPPLPLTLSWVREGILIVGMESEMRVYNQWNIAAIEQVEKTHEVTGNETALSAAGLKFDFDLSKYPQRGQLSIPTAGLAGSISVRQLRISPSHSMLDLARKGRETAPSSARHGRDRGRKKDAESAKKEELVHHGDSDVINIIRDEGLFEAARLATPLLPQYHPKQLMELLNAGKTRRVKAILLHVLRCIREHNVVYSDALARQASLASDDDGSSHGRSLSRSRLEAQPVDDLTRTVDIGSIPPLPLHALMAADTNTGGGAYGNETSAAANMANEPGRTNGYEELFSNGPETEELNVDWEDDTFEEDGNEDGTSFERKGSVRRHRQSVSFSDAMPPTAFSAKHSRMLSQLLTHIQLPGLSSVDQMHLLAVADTLSSFSADAIDRLAQANAVLKTSSGVPGVATTGGIGIDTVDECGLRFMMAMKQHEYLICCLPMKQRKQLRASGLPTSNVIWALHSETENELLNSLSCMQKGTPRWEELRAVGVGWWLKTPSLLKLLMEKVAKAAFQAKSDPMDASLYYLAMKKKNLLTHLYKTISDKKMADFFMQDFSQDKWQKAALKNAFILMGKQRFQHAVAFFLLGGSLSDALQVCVANLNDLQLASVIVRLYESDLDKQQLTIKKLLRVNVLGYSPETDTSSTCSLVGSADELDDAIDYSSASPDPFLRSMAYWHLKDYRRSALTLLEDPERYFQANESDDALKYSVSDVFNFYVYLRMHPLVVRQRLDEAGVRIGSTERFLQVAKALEGQITPVERKLYFKTAATHFKSGCALLALEVLCKLPKHIYLVDDSALLHDKETRKLSAVNVKVPEIVVRSAEQQSQLEKADAFDWSASAFENGPSKKPKDELELKWSDDEKEDEDDDDDDDGLVMKSKPADNVAELEREIDKEQAADSAQSQLVYQPKEFRSDIMAQQLKFVACLKILMEELATLASGYEVDGGQLRVQLFNWLEKEVEVLKRWCDYNVGISMDNEDIDEEAAAVGLDDDSQPVLLHEALRNDRQTLEAKLVHVLKRRRWLAANQQLLRTLIAYCSLHSSQGVGLASARMELLLLLQELHQEPTAQKTLLASPIPFQSSFPLLAASVASIKTDIAGPLRYLHCQISDLLKSFAELRTPTLDEPSVQKVCTFYNLAQSLSACIYDSLWDIENLPAPKGNVANLSASYLIRRRRNTSANLEPELAVTTAPCKWPGVENLLALLSRERDEDVPNLLMLLIESWVAVYVTLFAYAVTTYDSRWLFRLSAHAVHANMFATVFGGGGEKKVAAVPDLSDKVSKPSRPPPPKSPRSREPSPNPLSIDNLTTAVNPSKIRAKFNARVFGSTTASHLSPNLASPAISNGSPTMGTPNSSPQLVTTVKQWVPPKKSIISYLASRPAMQNVDLPAIADYDSDASLDAESDTEEADDDVSISTSLHTRGSDTKVHGDPNSFAWAVLRVALIRQAILRLQTFLSVCGLEYAELGAISPLIHRCFKTLEGWRHYAECIVDHFPGGCPPNFLPDMNLDVNAGSAGPSLRKYRVLFEPDNTPFHSTDPMAAPVKRLWLYLIRQEHLTDIFIRYIFRARKPSYYNIDGVHDNLANNNTGGAHIGMMEPIKIAQREQDAITAFAVSQTHFARLVLATSREIQEMDLSSTFIGTADWMHDATELDLAMFDMKKDPLRDNDDYVLVAPPPEKRDSSGARSTTFHLTPFVVDRSRYGLRKLCKRQTPGVRRMEAHPYLPYYVSGANDGSVKLWDWGVTQPLFTPRPGGQFGKVTRTRFNAHGNKFGITDSDGQICLWQISHGMTMKKPFLNFKCHTKSASDFVFIGNSSSLLATAGYSSGDVNIALWDSLLPSHKALVQGWSCHPDGATCLAYAPALQLLLSAGRHGEICMWDVRQRQSRHTLKAFDHATVKCMALDPAQEFFAAGSGDGDVKIWSLTPKPQLLYNLPGEHAAKGGFSLRQVGSGQVQGVQQIYIDAQQRLYSCGADNSLKVRFLQTQESIAG